MDITEITENFCVFVSYMDVILIFSLKSSTCIGKFTYWKYSVANAFGTKKKFTDTAVLQLIVCKTLVVYFNDKTVRW